MIGSFKKKSYLLLFLILMLAPLELIAQQTIQVKGKVADNDGVAVIGATVYAQKTKSTALTDRDGKFTLKCASDDVLKISFIGMETKNIKVNGKDLITVEMKFNENMLDEVVAVGYVKMKKKDFTGSLSSISGEKLVEVPVTNVAEALAGKVPGLQITQTNGEIDGVAAMTIRGGTSITSSNEPLVIIDGVPSEIGLVGLSSSDVASIDVLKDASSCAIYGARGANGVILVTTKGSVVKNPSVSYEMYYGISKVRNTVDVLDAADFVRLQFERLRGSQDVASIQRLISTYGNWSEISQNYPSSATINWQDKFFGQDATKQMHKVNVSGGDKTTSYNFSYTRNDEQGVMVNSKLARDVVRASVSTKMNDKLTVKVNGNYSNQVGKGMQTTNYGSLMLQMLTYRPTGGIKLNPAKLLNAAEDSIDATTTLVNPIVNAQVEDNQRIVKVLSGNASVEYLLAKNIIYRGNIAYTSTTSRNTIYYGSGGTSSKINGGPMAKISNSYSNNIMYNNTISYSNLFDKLHEVKLLLGQEANLNNAFTEGLTASAFPAENFALNDLGIAPVSSVSSSPGGNESYSYFSNLNYTFNSKYLMTFTVRADGSQKLGINNKWGVFPSSALAWRAGEEKFIQKLKFFSNLKFRLSYGMTGNSNIPPFTSLNLYDRALVSIDNKIVSTYGSAQLPNPDLRWEKNITGNFGIDFGFFKNRITGTIELYNTVTKDLLLMAKVPYTTGQPAMMQNIGSTQNRGLEIQLGTVNIKTKKFTWETDFNISFNRNKVLSLANGAESFITSASSRSSFQYLVKVGEPLGLMYGYVYDGLYTTDDFNYDALNKKYTLKPGVTGRQGYTITPGMAKFKNVDGSADNLVTTADKDIIGRARPLFFGGFSNTFRYSGFDLSIFLNFSYGGQVYNGTSVQLMSLPYNSQNVLRKAFDGRYKEYNSYGEFIYNDPVQLAAVNKNAKYPSISGWRQSLETPNSMFVEDGSFIRINNLSLGYTFSTKFLSKVKIKSCRLYATVYNVYTFTNYTGFDPEVSVNDNAITPGLDWGSQARPKSGVLGLSITL